MALVFSIAIEWACALCASIVSFRPRGWAFAGLALLTACDCVSARDARGPDVSLRLLRSFSVALPATPAAGDSPAPHRMRVAAALLAGTGWSTATVLEALRGAGAILAQCGIELHEVEFSEFEGPARFRMLSTPVSRQYARIAAIGRPAVFFVSDTAHRPAFDAEAFGRGNTRTRPEMADSVWVTSAARDLPIAIAHELAHVLADSGAHSDDPGNLMREDTAPGGVRLDADQCGAIVRTGVANGLLQPRRPASGVAER